MMHGMTSQALHHGAHYVTCHVSRVTLSLRSLSPGHVTRDIHYFTITSPVSWFLDSWNQTKNLEIVEAGVEVRVNPSSLYLNFV